MTMPVPYTTQDEAALRDAAMLAVDHATRLSASGVAAAANAGGGIRIVVRDGVAETAVRDGYQSLRCTVYRDGRNGQASTAALDPASIRRAAEEAFAIAGQVEEDPTAGLADPATLAFDGVMPPMLAPSGMDAGALLDRALEMEALVKDQPQAHGIDIRVSEAGAASSDAVMALATSAGFCRSGASSAHARWAMVLARGADGSVQDYDDSSDRQFGALAHPALVATNAVARATARLGGRSIASRRTPVLFDARIAPALVHELVGALSGGAQYRRASFLLDALGTPVMASHLDLNEDPFEPFGMGSGGFDGEGVAGSTRPIVEAGVARGYFLATTSARRLGMRSTGNANGCWNLRLTSRAAGGDAAAMRAMLGTGLIVTQLLGGATDPVSGTWTRAAAGLWVENGVIVHPVADITLAGSMRDMLAGIVAVGDDVRRAGPIRTGSILIDTLQIGGAA